MGAKQLLGPLTAAADLLDRATPVAGQRLVRVPDSPLHVAPKILGTSAVADNVSVRLPQVLVDADGVPCGLVSVGGHVATVRRGYPHGNQCVSARRGVDRDALACGYPHGHTIRHPKGGDR